MAPVRIVFFDIGGVMYDDRVYADALRRALRDLGASFTDADFDDTYTRLRARQEGPFRRRLAERYLGRTDTSELERIAARYWAYPAGSLAADVRPCLERLRRRVRLGVIANQPSAVREALVRDDLTGYFDTWALSDDLDLHKPDPRLFRAALELARVEAADAVMVGDRLDYDVRPARLVGIRAVWVLRGEAPDRPTPEQLAEADAAVHGLDELPTVLDGIEDAR